MENRPYIWQMVKEAVQNLGGQASNYEIKKYIFDKYTDVNENTINCTILSSCVNKQSRVNFTENQRERSSTSQYDFLYSTSRGKVELYEPQKHGLWKISKTEEGTLLVCQENGTSSPPEPMNPLKEADEPFSFPLESHLRDFIAKNLSSLSLGHQKLRLFVDNEGNDGVEYQTPVGRIDILALNENEEYVVFELKLSKGADQALGQILRYMGWLKSTMSTSKPVKGVIVAGGIDDKLKFAASIIPEVTLFKYEISFAMQEVVIDSE